jgi:hypothetical protein
MERSNRNREAVTLGHGAIGPQESTSGKDRESQLNRILETDFRDRWPWPEQHSPGLRMQIQGWLVVSEQLLEPWNAWSSNPGFRCFTRKGAIAVDP